MLAFCFLPLYIPIFLLLQNRPTVVSVQIFQQQNLRKRLRLSEDGKCDSKQSDADEPSCDHSNSEAQCRVPLMHISNQPAVRSTHVSYSVDITTSLYLSFFSHFVLYSLQFIEYQLLPLSF